MDEVPIEIERKAHEATELRLRSAIQLLREWRDKYGGREHYTFTNTSGMPTASPTDLASATQRCIEGR